MFKIIFVFIVGPVFKFIYPYIRFSLFLLHSFDKLHITADIILFFNYKYLITDNKGPGYDIKDRYQVS
jgi:hypothetical protein